jgi:vacuolar-type H+-ATPase subunit I/STV1
MDWEQALKLMEKLIKISATVGAAAALVEIIFGPVRGLLEKRRNRLERENRIDDSLAKIDQHLEESTRLAEWQTAVDATLARHEQSIEDSKTERRVTWRAQRATLDGLKQLGANGLVSKAITEMDDYADENMR